MRHNIVLNPNDLPPLRTSVAMSGFPYHISIEVINQNGYKCHYNYKYDKWCFNEGYSEEMIWWEEIGIN